MPPLGYIRIIGGKWRARHIKVIDSKDLRPTSDRVRETLFNWLNQDVINARCLDLFAGTGALGFEALSRGASYVTFVENQPQAIKSLHATAAQLQSENTCEIILSDALKWLKHYLPMAEPFDLIFLDPPFSNTALLSQSIDLLTNSSCVNENTLLYLEAPKMMALHFPSSWALLKHKTTKEVGYYLLRGAAKP